MGFDLVEEAFKSMTSEGGKFFDLMDAQSKTFLGQVSNIQDSFIKIGRVMGEIFLPAAKFVAENLAVIVGWMEKHPTLAKFAAVALIVGTTLALIVGPLLILVAMLPAISAGLGMVATGMTAVSIAGLPVWGVILLIGAAIAALIAVGYLLIKNWDTIKVKAKPLVDFLKIIFGPTLLSIQLGVQLITLAFVGLKDIITKLWNKLKPFAVWLRDVLSPILKTVIDLIKFVLDKGGKAFDSASANIGSLGARGTVKSVGDAIIRPNGDIIKTHPQDTLIATKNPGGMGGVVVNIENVNGLDADVIAEALQDKLEQMIRV